ncbi:FecR domain-containing protein [Caulobacter sp. 1776]|uniref:FecR domain-containing protein n=1 Tax=Caulobacter sp. 1776 TaxID=3156420 RepID=UPI003397CC82
MLKAAGAGLILLALMLGAGSASAQARAQTAVIPEPPVAYAVKPGDTLIGLGRAYLNRPGDYRAVQKANRVKRPRRMRAGSQLNIDPMLLKSTPIAASLSACTGPVFIETNGRQAPARIGMALSEGQSIITGPNAFATFEMEDGSRITLPSNTRVRIAKLRQVLINNAPQRVFQLDQGRSAISATPTQNPAAKFEVHTPVSVSAVRGTEFRVSFLDGKAHTEVLAGAVGVDAGTVVTHAPPVPAGFGVSATPGAVTVPVKLSPAPKLDTAGQNQSDKTVHFAVEPVADASAYRLQLSRDAGFIDVFAEATTTNPAADFGELANGTYFVRLTVLDSGGLEGLPADYSFDRDLDTLDTAPPVDSREGDHRKFLFRWSSAGDGVRSYRFQLFAKDGAKLPLVDQPGLSEPQLTLTDLPAGVYAWRVAAIRFKKGAVTEKVGPLQTLQIGK